MVLCFFFKLKTTTVLFCQIFLCFCSLFISLWVLLDIFMFHFWLRWMNVSFTCRCVVVSLTWAATVNQKHCIQIVHICRLFSFVLTELGTAELKLESHGFRTLRHPLLWCKMSLWWNKWRCLFPFTCAGFGEAADGWARWVSKNKSVGGWSKDVKDTGVWTIQRLNNGNEGSQDENSQMYGKL